VYRGLHGTTTAPMRRAPKNAMRNCGQLGRSIATLSPGFTPSERSPAENRFASSNSDAYDRFALKKIVAVDVGYSSAAWSSTACSGTSGYTSDVGTSAS